MAAEEDLSLSHMINELRSGESHIGWFQTNLSLDRDNAAPLIKAFAEYDSSKLVTLQLDYCRFHHGTFSQILQSLKGCHNLKYLYLTHDHALDADDIALFLRHNNVYLTSLNVDTTSVDLKVLCNLIREGRIAFLDCGSSMGSAESYVEDLAMAQKGQKCIIRTERLLANIYRYNGAFAPKNDKERAVRAEREAQLKIIEQQNQAARLLGAEYDYGQSAKRCSSSFPG
ncbi:hypothetical protein L7F22_029264 [Adiantum nelumboides]|nr:hypothetical protein [Adiantum nelumboides]